MKLNYFLAGAAIALLGLSSCNNDDVKVNETSGVVKLHATINDVAKTRLGNTWAGTEAIGLYMVEVSEGFEAIVSNKEYSVTSAGIMTPADGEEATYPKDGRNVNFISYYPYTESLADNVYAIDLSDASVADHDLVYAQAGPFNQTKEDAVALAHAHQLTLLTVNVQDEEGTAITTASAKINRPVKASFDLTDGTLTVNATSVADMEMTAGETTVNAMIIPGTAGKIVFANDGKTFTWDISSIVFEAGKKYTYTVKLIPSLIPAVEVVGTATITPWDEVVADEAIGLDEDDEVSGGDNSDTPVYTSNVTLPTTTSAIQTNAYGGKVKVDGVEYDCLKLGTGSAGGSYEVAIGVGKTKATFYAFAWNGDNNSPELVVSISDPVSSSSVNLVANTGASGSSPYIIAAFESTALHTVTFDETVADATITFSTTGSKKRAVIFAINVE